MARVTVEDCIMEIPNRFDLVLIAAQRAKQISVGNPLTIDRDNDKDSVVALREIADKTISLPQLEESLIQGFYKRPVADVADQKLLTAGEEISADVEDAFREAAQNISDARNAGGRAVASEEEADGGMAFGGDDVESED